MAHAVDVDYREFGVEGREGNQTAAAGAHDGPVAFTDPLQLFNVRHTYNAGIAEGWEGSRQDDAGQNADHEEPNALGISLARTCAAADEHDQWCLPPQAEIGLAKHKIDKGMMRDPVTGGRPVEAQ